MFEIVKNAISERWCSDSNYKTLNTQHTIKPNEESTHSRPEWLSLSDELLLRVAGQKSKSVLHVEAWGVLWLLMTNV